MGWSTVVFENRATPSRLPGKTALLHPASLGKPRYSIPPPWENRATPSRLSWENRATPSRLPGKTALLHPASGETALLHPASLGKPRYSIPPLVKPRYSIPPPWANRATPSRLPGKTAPIPPLGKPCYSFPRLTYLRTPKAARNKGGHNTHTHSHTVLLHSSLNVLLQR